ncbi:MAG: archaemetzincin [bacterium]
MKFKPPNKSERINSIGSTEKLSETDQRAFDPNGFEPIPKPKSGDWLSEHQESGQTFDQFKQQNWKQPDSSYNTIYLQPLGRFPENKSPSLELLREYVENYYTLRVNINNPLNLKKHNITIRINPYSRNIQILTSDVLNILTKQLPKDAFCLMGISMEDLYPDPSWNFVFGQASINDRVGVYSFARYHPAFYREKPDKNFMQILLKRSCKVLVHEIGHMFGLNHCIYFHCIMNGSNHLQESDSRPLHLCPVCLHKLKYSIGFDIVEWYKKLHNFYQQHGFTDEADKIKNRLDYILDKK